MLPLYNQYEEVVSDSHRHIITELLYAYGDSSMIKITRVVCPCMEVGKPL